MTFSTALVKLMGRYDEISCGSLPGLSIGIIIACLQSCGICPSVQTLLYKSKRILVERFERCCIILYEILSLPGAECFFISRTVRLNSDLS